MHDMNHHTQKIIIQNKNKKLVVLIFLDNLKKKIILHNVKYYKSSRVPLPVEL